MKTLSFLDKITTWWRRAGQHHGCREMEIVWHAARRGHCYGPDRCVHRLVGLSRRSSFTPISAR